MFDLCSPVTWHVRNHCFRNYSKCLEFECCHCFDQVTYKLLFCFANVDFVSAFVAVDRNGHFWWMGHRPDILCIQHSPFFTLFRPFFHAFLKFVFRFFLVSFVLCPSPLPLFDISTWRWLEASDVINDGDDDDVRSRRRLFPNVTPKMTPIDLLTPILGLHLFVHFLDLRFQQFFSIYMYP